MEEYIRAQERNDEIWDLLEDPTLSSLDQQLLNEELITNSFIIMRFEGEFEYDDEEYLETIEDLGGEV